MATVDAPLLGTTTLLSLLAIYGLYRWLGPRILGDDGHKSALVCAALGLVLATSLVLIAGASDGAYAAGLVPWVMVSFFAYEAGRFTGMAAGTGAWAIWWTIEAAAAWLAGLRSSL